MSVKSQGLVVLLAVSGLLISGATELSYSKTSNTRTPNSVANADSHSIVCSDLPALSQWSRERSQGIESESLDSDIFRERAARLYLEKLDPFRLLILAPEAKSFATLVKDNWQDLLSGANCNFFVQWTAAQMQIMRARLDKLYAALPLRTITPNKFAEFPSDVELPEYQQFASTETQLQQRYVATVRALAQSTSLFSVKAFRNDVRALLKADLSQAALGDSTPHPLELMMKAFLASIDPYSTYFSPQEFDDFYLDLAGATTGIGVLVRKVPDGLLVLKTVEGSPADLSKAVAPGDIILEISGKALKPMAELEARNLLKGQRNTRLQLKLASVTDLERTRTVTIVRQEFTLEQARVSTKVVNLEGKDNGSIAILTIPSFYGRSAVGALESERSSAEDLRDALVNLMRRKRKLRAVILDLRGNPGGFLEEAIAMGGLFLGDKPIVTVLENSRKRVVRDTAPVALYSGPLIALVDHKSASAAEILVGALQDYQRAIVIGDNHTYGKGSVQKLFYLSQEYTSLANPLHTPQGVVKLTTSIFFSPKGHTPLNGGIKADIAMGAQDGAKLRSPKVVYHRVHDTDAIVDTHDVRNIESVRLSNQARLDELRTKHQDLTKDVSQLIDKAFKKELGIEGQPSPEQIRLAKAVVIASDYAATMPSGSQSTASEPLQTAQNKK